VFSRLFEAVAIETKDRREINCKSWRCPRHRHLWGRKWGAILGEQLTETPCDLLLNLTTAESATTKDEIEVALRYFMRKFRKLFGPTEYIKVTEASQKDHSRVHFHLLLVNPALRTLIPPMPDNWPGKLSWPGPLFETLKALWEAALLFAAPARRPTTVIWCQPPKNGAKAANYAIGYITGKNKNEEPDETWKGRKLTYSRGFFTRKTQQIWATLLERWFGPRQELTYFWQPKCDLSLESLFKIRTKTTRKRVTPLQPLSLSHIPIDQLSQYMVSMQVTTQYTDADQRGIFAKMPIMVERYKAARFYDQEGHLPGFGPCNFPKAPVFAEPIYEIGPSGQMYFG
jgi:hypothetical protein